MKSAPCLVIAAAVLLAACAGPPPAPGDSAYRGRAAAAYRLGYHHGYMDGSNKLDENFKRYHDEFRPEAREVFARGYEAGHEAGRREAGADESDRDRAFQDGLDAGRADAANGLRPDPLRHGSRFTAGTAESFREGYAKGWHDAREQ